MEEMILNLKESSSSGTGFSYYNSVLQCPRKARLDAKFSRKDQKDSHSDILDIGTIYHKLMEMYFTNNQQKLVLENPDVSENESLIEAQRLFSAFTHNHKREHFGSVVDVELKVPKDDDVVFKERIKRTFGAEVTARFDLVVEKDGFLVIVDHKTHLRKEPKLVQYYMSSLQGQLYCMLAEMYYNKPVAGTIYSLVYRHKKLTSESFEKIFVPYDPENNGIVLTFILNAATMSTIDFPNVSNCFPYGYACKYLLNGLCNRR